MSLCRKKPLHARYASGCIPAASLSNLALLDGGTQYQILGAPQCRKLTEYRSASSTCHAKKLCRVCLCPMLAIPDELIVCEFTRGEWLGYVATGSHGHNPTSTQQHSSSMWVLEEVKAKIK
jgi:hypothetical protein